MLRRSLSSDAEVIVPSPKPLACAISASARAVPEEPIASAQWRFENCETMGWSSLRAAISARLKAARVSLPPGK
jgi:hypothetical protein